MIAMEALIAEAAPLPPAPQPNEAVTGIYYTGGTTGHPKGVMHSALSLWAGATCIAMEMQGPRHHRRSEEHTSELPSLMRISYAVFCLKKKNTNNGDTV